MKGSPFPSSKSHLFLYWRILISKLHAYCLQTFEYIVVSGARRQENRWDPTENEQVVPEDKETSKRLFDDAMFKLEHQNGDQKQSKNAQPILARLTEKRERFWHDDYAANSTLRQQFRVS